VGDWVGASALTHKHNVAQKQLLSLTHKHTHSVVLKQFTHACARTCPQTTHTTHTHHTHSVVLKKFTRARARARINPPTHPNPPTRTPPHTQRGAKAAAEAHVFQGYQPCLEGDRSQGGDVDKGLLWKVGQGCGQEDQLWQKQEDWPRQVTGQALQGGREVGAEGAGKCSKVCT